jgi:hypothetical protein
LPQWRVLLLLPSALQTFRCWISLPSQSKSSKCQQCPSQWLEHQRQLQPPTRSQLPKQPR